MDYHKKYIKYKNKYIKLKNQNDINKKQTGGNKKVPKQSVKDNYKDYILSLLLKIINDLQPTTTRTSLYKTKIYDFVTQDLRNTLESENNEIMPKLIALFFVISTLHETLEYSINKSERESKTLIEVIFLKIMYDVKLDNLRPTDILRTNNNLSIYNPHNIARFIDPKHINYFFNYTKDILDEKFVITDNIKAKIQVNFHKISKLFIFVLGNILTVFLDLETLSPRPQLLQGDNTTAEEFQENFRLVVNTVLSGLLSREVQTLISNRSIRESDSEMSIKWEIIRPTLGRYVDPLQWLKARRMQETKTRGVLTTVNVIVTFGLTIGTLGIVTKQNPVSSILNFGTTLVSMLSMGKYRTTKDHPLFNDMKLFLIRSKDVLSTIARLKSEIYRQSRLNEKKLHQAKKEMRARFNNDYDPGKFDSENYIDPVQVLLEKVLDTSSAIALGYYCVWKYYEKFTSEKVVKYTGERFSSTPVKATEDEIENYIKRHCQDSMFTQILDYITHDTDNVPSSRFLY